MAVRGNALPCDAQVPLIILGLAERIVVGIDARCAVVVLAQLPVRTERKHDVAQASAVARDALPARCADRVAGPQGFRTLCAIVARPTFEILPTDRLVLEAVAVGSTVLHAKALNAQSTNKVLTGDRCGTIRLLGALSADEVLADRVQEEAIRAGKTGRRSALARVSANVVERVLLLAGGRVLILACRALALDTDLPVAVGACLARAARARQTGLSRRAVRRHLAQTARALDAPLTDPAIRPRLARPARPLHATQPSLTLVRALAARLPGFFFFLFAPIHRVG